MNRDTQDVWTMAHVEQLTDNDDPPGLMYGDGGMAPTMLMVRHGEIYTGLFLYLQGDRLHVDAMGSQVGVTLTEFKQYMSQYARDAAYHLLDLGS